VAFAGAGAGADGAGAGSVVLRHDAMATARRAIAVGRIDESMTERTVLSAAAGIGGERTNPFWRAERRGVRVGRETSGRRGA